MGQAQTVLEKKKIFGIFGFINTIKITNGKVSEVASLVLTIEVERFFYTHTSQSWKQLVFFLRDSSVFLLRVKRWTSSQQSQLSLVCLHPSQSTRGPGWSVSQTSDWNSLLVRQWPTNSLQKKRSLNRIAKLPLEYRCSAFSVSTRDCFDSEANEQKQIKGRSN